MQPIKLDDEFMDWASLDSAYILDEIIQLLYNGPQVLKASKDFWLEENKEEKNVSA